MESQAVKFKAFTSVVFAALAVSACTAQGIGAAPRQSASTLAAGQQRGVFQVELAKSLDSKKLKAGDEVEAKLAGSIQTGDGTTIPSGSRVIGHVTEAKARSKGDAESALGIVFDKIGRAGGATIPIESVIQAVAPNPNSGLDSSGGVSYGGLSEATEKMALPTQNSRSVPLLNEQSAGVFGIKNMQLGSGGVITFSGKEVKLDSGTRILLNVTM